jgi:hypothetical protein
MNKHGFQSKRRRDMKFFIFRLKHGLSIERGYINFVTHFVKIMPQHAHLFHCDIVTDDKPAR